MFTVLGIELSIIQAEATVFYTASEKSTVKIDQTFFVYGGFRGMNFPRTLTNHEKFA